MGKIEQIPWETPTKKKRTSSVVPMITITSKAFKTGAANKTAPYWRAAFNNAFVEKYWPGQPKVKRISIYVGGQGVMVDIKPARTQTAYELRIGNYFNDEDLINKLFRHFGIPLLSKPNITTMHLHIKPGKKYDEKLIYEFVYMNEENPQLTQLENLKQQMEADENFPEADVEKKQTIKVEG